MHDVGWNRLLARYKSEKRQVGLGCRLLYPVVYVVGRGCHVSERLFSIEAVWLIFQFRRVIP